MRQDRERERGLLQGGARQTRDEGLEGLELAAWDGRLQDFACPGAQEPGAKAQGE